MRRICCAIALAGGVLAAVPAAAQTAPAPDGMATLTPDQAREVGLAAIAQGRPDLALGIAQALLARDATDTFAWYLQATALFQTGEMAGAQASARQSYRYSHSDQQSYQSARLTALAAYNRAHYGSAQWWLRRAVQYAPEDALHDQSLQEFNAVRRKNPLSINLSFSLVPSDNVNNGSSGSFNVIDGVPYVGVLSPDAKALPGWIGEASLDLAYRLSESQTGSTYLGFYLYGQEITLSDSALADLGDIPAPDLGARRGEVTLRHVFGTTADTHTFTLGVTLGLQQEGRADAQSYGRLSLGYAQALGPNDLINIAGALEQREAVYFQAFGDRVATLRAAWLHNFADADTLTASLFGSRYQTYYDGLSSVTFGGDVTYDIARDFGPVNLSLAAGLFQSRFPGYTIATIVVPSGRRDLTGYLQMDVLFPRVEYNGFAPVLTLRRQVTSSNVSRFDSVESSISLGIQSTF